MHYVQAKGILSAKNVRINIDFPLAISLITYYDC